MRSIREPNKFISTLAGVITLNVFLQQSPQVQLDHIEESNRLFHPKTNQHSTILIMEILIVTGLANIKLEDQLSI